MKKIIRILTFAACFVFLFSVCAFADTKITKLTISAGPDDDAPMTDGGLADPLFSTDDAEYVIDGCVDTSTSGSYKSPHTYELTLYASDGYYFPSVSGITVTKGAGIVDVVKKSLDNDTTLILKVKAYPYYKHTAPTVEEFDPTDAKTIRWNRNGAAQVQYILEYVNQSGDEKSKTGTTTSTSLTVSSYTKKATSDSKEDAYITGFAIRGYGKAGDNTKTAPSDWVIAEGNVDPEDYDFDIYEVWSDTESASESKGGSTSGGSNGSTGIPSSVGPSAALNKTGWYQAGQDWYYKDSDGKNHVGWLLDGEYWYLLDADGKMFAGWAQDGGKQYYMNTNHDGTYGRMMTGWQVVDGVNHYFNEVHDGTFGCLIQ